MQLISKFNKGIRFLSCVVDVYSKHGWGVPIKHKKYITSTNAFWKIESNFEPNKIWVDEGSEFYNRSMKSWLRDNDIEICSTHNAGNTNGKYHSIQIELSKYKKLFSPERKTHPHIHHLFQQFWN